MKTFDEIYEELQNEGNEELNDAWKEAKKKKDKANKISGIICLIIDIFIVVMFLNMRINPSTQFFTIFKIIPFFVKCIFVIGVNISVVAIVNVLFCGKEQDKYNQEYKKTVINKIMSNFYDNLEYFPQKEMPEYLYEEPHYHEYYDIYESEDYLEGQINNKYNIQMAEVLTKEEKEYEDSNGETQTTEITKFHGLFAKIIMDKSIESEIKILQNGKIFKKNRVEMDSSEFEKYFDVQASNQIIGMQLLTADVMGELVDFQNKTNIEYDIVIKNNNLYLRFHCEDMFEVDNLRKGPLNRETLKKYFDVLDFTYNLSNKLVNTVNYTEI